MIYSKINVNKITLQNRVTVSPMCQYSAIDGCPSEWHYRHLSNLIESGAGLLTVESTAVCKEGLSDRWPKTEKGRFKTDDIFSVAINIHNLDSIK